MNDHDQLREQMWDLVYGLTTAEETAALHARIKSDPKIARLYAEVRLESDLLAQAARVEASVHLADPAPTTHQPAAGRAKPPAAASSAGRGRTILSLHWFSAVAASALAVLLAVGIFFRTDQPQAEPTHLVSIRAYYSQGDALVSGLPQQIELEARDGQGNPVSVPLTTQIAAADGPPRYEYKLETNDGGRANMPVPADALAAGVKLRVLHDAELLAEAPLPVREEPLETSVTLDKEWYQPGDVVRWRAVNLTAFTRQAKDAQSLSFQLHMDDQALAPDDSVELAGTGIVTGEFSLPPDAPQGLYALTVQSEPQAEPQTEALVAVGREGALLPESETYFRRSARGSAGKPVELAMRDDGKFTGGGLGKPEGGARGRAVAEVDGKSRQNGARPSSPRPPRPDLAAQPAPAAVAPPAPASAPASDAPPRPAAKTFEKPYSEGVAAPVDSIARKMKVATPSLQPADKREKSESLVLAEGDAVQLAIPAEAEGKKLSVETKYRGLVLAKIQVPQVEEKLGQASEFESGQALSDQIQVPLPPVTGEVEVTLFDDSASQRRPLLTQRVMRMPRNEFNIDLQAMKESYAPGEKVQLTVEVKDDVAQQAIAQAMLGVNVRPALSRVALNEQLARVKQLAQTTDEAASPGLKADQKELEPPRPGLAGRASGRGGAQKTESKTDPADVADRPADADQSALPSKALSRSAPGSDATGAAVFAPEDLAERQQGFFTLGDRILHSEVLAATDAVEPPSGPRLLVSNEAQIQQELERRKTLVARREAKAALWKGMLGRCLLAGGVFMLLVVAVGLVMQRPASPRMWAPSLAIAGACFVVGLIWLLNQPRNPQTVAQRSDFGDAAGVEEPKAAHTMSPPSGPSPTAELPEQPDPSSSASPMQSTAEAVGGFSASSAPSGEPSDGALVKQLDAAAPGESIQLKQEFVRPAPKPGETREPSAAGATSPEMNNQPATPQAAADNEQAKAVRLRSALEIRPSRKSGAGERAEDEARLKKEGVHPPLEKGLAERDLERVDKKNSSRGKTTLLTEKERVEDAELDLARLKDQRSQTRQPNTIVWQPLVRADENGHAVIEFTMPEVPGDYRLVLDVHGAGRVGQLQVPLRCEAPAAATTPAAAAEK